MEKVNKVLDDIKNKISSIRTRPIKHRRLYVALREVLAIAVLVLVITLSIHGVLALAAEWPLAVGMTVAPIYITIVFIGLSRWYRQFCIDLHDEQYAHDIEPLEFRQVSGHDSRHIRIFRYDMMVTTGKGRLALHKMEWIDFSVNLETREARVIGMSDESMRCCVKMNFDFDDFMGKQS